MIAEQILAHRGEQTADADVVLVPFQWFELEKKRITKTADDGCKIGIAIDDLLQDGDVIARSEGKEYVVCVQQTRLIQIHVDTMEQMGRLGFELGNRHLSLQIQEHEVCVPYDAPTFEYLGKLGFEVKDITGTFTDYIVCKAHGDGGGHSHSHSHSHNHSHSHSQD